MSVRVLLVEGDDSTRHVITALLRKCSYKVAATSDGLKAWETLKEKHQNIDLVLMEVELPSISGFSLLTMIMDHETYKNIPVIMMSSHDSISMVFKCMQEGAADFLVKPIRKNELKNLWQHVWRRQISSYCHGVHQDGSHASHKFEATPEYGDHSTEYVACMQKNKENSEHGSDAESSCTRSDVEAESARMQNMMEHKQQKSRDISFVDLTLAQTVETCTHLNSALLLHESDANVAVTMNKDLGPTQCLNNNDIMTETYGRNIVQNKPSKVIDLNNQSQPNHARGHGTAAQDGFSNIAGSHGHENEIMCKASPMPHLELSLRRYEDVNPEKQENDEWNTWNHSNSSAFSVYHSRSGMPTSLTPRNFGTEQKECYSTSSKTLPDQGCNNASSAFQFKGLGQNINLEDRKSLGVGPPSHDGMAVRCTPIRVIPFPIPVGGISFDNLCGGYGPVMQQPLHHPQSAHSLLVPKPSTRHGEPAHTNLSHQSDQNNLNSLLSDHPSDQSARNPTHHSAEKQEETAEMLDEQRYVSSATAESGSGSICNGGRSHLNSSGGGSACNESTGHDTVSNLFKAATESGNHDGIIAHEGTKPMDFHRLTQREAALNKFRMKRKDRCYEKKVRYQSRKLLAEKRPRVKGQFVRQAQLSPQSVGAGCHHGDPTTG